VARERLGAPGRVNSLLQQTFSTRAAIFAVELQGSLPLAQLPEKSIRRDFGQGPDRSAAGKR
jgi:hypothetical protein